VNPEREDHACTWRDYALELEAKHAVLEAKLAAVLDAQKSLERRFLGPKSEKMPPMEREVRRDQPVDPAETQRKRRERAAAKAEIETEIVKIDVPADQRQCPNCGRPEMAPVGDGKPSTVFDYVPGHFVRKIYRRETLACSCGEHIVTAPAPDKSTEKTRYSPRFVAHLMVSKCGDSTPIYRLAKGYRRLGIPIARSTMTDLFHRNAQVLAPLSRRLIELVAQQDVVLADETSIKMLGSSKRAFIWTFIAETLIAYRFSVDRSGQTPLQVLGESEGTLVVDAYTGYNRVLEVSGRERGGCLAHARRKLFEAKGGAPEAAEALELIRQVYVVEHGAKERGIARTPAHLALRQARSKPLMGELKNWLDGQQGLHAPKSLMGRAVRYAINNWVPLTRFLDDAAIPPDNNRSESALRVVATGRKNFLFVGNEDAGENIAGVYSLIATCEANGVNPFTYLQDVLVRVQTHPAARIDELLPHRWQQAASQDTAEA
jgi:transposase